MFDQELVNLGYLYIFGIICFLLRFLLQRLVIILGSVAFRFIFYRYWQLFNLKFSTMILNTLMVFFELIFPYDIPKKQHLNQMQDYD